MTATTVDTLLSDPHGAYAVLRRSAPAHRLTLPGGAKVWLVTRYHDVRACLADPRLSLDKHNAGDGWTGFSLPPRLDANLLNMDPPDHSRIRRLVSQAFTPRRVEALRPRITAIAGGLLDQLEHHRHADLITAYAAPLPIAVICDILGVPHADQAQLRAWTDALFSHTSQDPDAAARAVPAIEQFLVDLVRRKRSEPGDDLLTAMISARDADDRLSEDELTSLAFLTFFAGYENSTSLIGNCILALLLHPRVLHAVQTEPAQLRAAIEETLRYEPATPVSIRRFAVQDITIGGSTIAAGDTVLLGLAAANRDPDVFDDPDTFQLRPDGPAHLSLGYGPHHCLGAALAHLETHIAVSELLRRYPLIELATPADQVRWRASFRSRALRTLPVSMTR